MKFKAQVNLLPNQMQSIMVEQNKQILEKFNTIIQKQSSICYSVANSIDGESNVSNSNALQIPTISTNSNNNNNSISNTLNTINNNNNNKQS